ncbi:tetratricopeptide repeat protein [Alkalibacterium sp. AK22]|uniref:tetratricopeptide repeat protein n=1 Tax=Alkalibacterium sp. AK22 TaxID=1229520 RepID=UPI000558BF1E|nr:tetratricopeptide repeat protein [Alkalibacterium sp. AK22]
MSYSRQMIEAIQNQQLKEAEHYFQEALMQDGDEELFALVETLYDLGFLGETKQLIRHLLQKHPEEDGLKLILAEIAIEEGSELEAFDWIDQVEEGSSFYPQALLVAADYYQVLDLPEVARKKLEEAKTILPNEPVIDFALGELLFTSGNYKEAIMHYEQLIISHHTEFAGTSLNSRLGNAYAATGDLESAIDYLKEAVELQETGDHLFQLGLVYFQKKDYDQANEQLYKVKELDPSYTSVYSYLAQGLLEQNKEQEALETIEEGLLHDRQNPSLYAMGARAALTLGLKDKTEELFGKALSLDPENITLTLEYCRFLFNQQAFEQALQLLGPKLAEGEEDPQLFWYAAMAYNELEEFDEARSFYNKAVQYLSDSPVFLKDYALFLREEGDRVRFIETARKLLAIDPTDTEVDEWIKYEETE